MTVETVNEGGALPLRKKPGPRPGTPRPRIDWDVIEAHYRAGHRTLTSLAVQFGVSDVGIIKHAKKHGWTRNLAGKVKDRTDQKLTEDLLRKLAPQEGLNEDLRVEIESEVRARILSSHRNGVTRARQAAMGMLAEIETACLIDNLGLDARRHLIERVLDDSATQDERLSLAITLKRAWSFDTRISAIKQLAEAMRTLIAIERQAYAIPESGALPTDLHRLSDEQLRIQTLALASKLGIAYAQGGSASEPEQEAQSEESK